MSRSSHGAERSVKGGTAQCKFLEQVLELCCWDVDETWLPQLLCSPLDKQMQQSLKRFESTKIGPCLRRSFLPHRLVG